MVTKIDKPLARLKDRGDRKRHKLLIPEMGTEDINADAMDIRKIMKEYYRTFLYLQI